jgi:HupE / UreJ protein
VILRFARLLAIGLALGAWLFVAPAHAHGVGMSTLHMTVDGDKLEGTWDLHLRDARLALGLEPMPEGVPAWNDLRAHEDSLRAVLLRSLAIEADSLPCAIALTPAPMEWDREFNNVRFHVVSTCPVAPKRLTMHCQLLFDLDPKHRAYFSVEDSRVTSVGVFRTALRSVSFDVRQFHFWEVVGEFIRNGIEHIWSGIDHILFLVALLLPAALLRNGKGWTPRPGFWSSTREVLKVVTAFTAAHTLTLCLSFFGIVRPPAQWVEVGIAISVFAAAWNNLRPFLPGRAWVMAGGFGLVHGLGFAGALGNLSLPRNQRVLALGTFNVGVEIGQLAIVLVIMPLLYASSRQKWYPRLVMGAGSLVIAWVAVLWTLQRAFSLEFFRPIG